jgi:hypothetical protein
MICAFASSTRRLISGVISFYLTGEVIDQSHIGTSGSPEYPSRRRTRPCRFARHCSQHTDEETALLGQATHRLFALGFVRNLELKLRLASLFFPAIHAEIRRLVEGLVKLPAHIEGHCRLGLSRGRKQRRDKGNQNTEFHDSPKLKRFVIGAPARYQHSLF